MSEPVMGFVAPAVSVSTAPKEVEIRDVLGAQLAALSRTFRQEGYDEGYDQALKDVASVILGLNRKAVGTKLTVNQFVELLSGKILKLRKGAL